MSWRSVFISKPAKLSLRDNALFIKQECEISVPLEDIAVVVIDCREVVITAPLLTALAFTFMILCFKMTLKLTTVIGNIHQSGTYMNSLPSRILMILFLERIK